MTRVAKVCCFLTKPRWRETLLVLCFFSVAFLLISSRFTDVWKYSAIVIKTNASLTSANVSFKNSLLNQSFSKHDGHITIKGTPQILLWTPLWNSMNHWKHIFADHLIKKSQCPTWNCRITKDKSKLPNSDAVLFAFQDLKVELPKKRLPQQVWALITKEPPHIINKNTNWQILQDYDDSFNWTITYRSDSTISYKYGVVQKIKQPAKTKRKKSKLENRNQLFDTILHKKYDVAWFVSNCKTPSKREHYIKVLSKYVTVHIYGKCGRLKCVKDLSGTCNKHIEKDYRFYLAFESSVCKDYVSDKLFKIFKLNTVPIVYGGANYSAIAPPHSYIDVRNFKTPKKLAEYLIRLRRNPRSYMRYFDWKKSYKVSTDNVACKLCKKLNMPIKRQHYDSISGWWEQGGNCQNP